MAVQIIPVEESLSTNLARMLSLAMIGEHVLIDQLPVLKHAVANVTVKAMIFAKPIVGVVLV